MSAPNAPQMSPGKDKTATFDPSANVLALVDAANERQDDLREANNKYLDARLDRLEEVVILRASCAKEIADQERVHRLELGSLETKYRDQQALAEKARIDAQRGEDKAAVALASTRAELTAGALAERVDTSAKALAATVEATAKTLAAAAEAISKALVGRIEPLEQARYTQAGRSGLSTPLLMLITTLGGGLIVFLIQQVMK